MIISDYQFNKYIADAIAKRDVEWHEQIIKMAKSCTRYGTDHFCEEFGCQCFDEVVAAMKG